MRLSLHLLPTVTRFSLPGAWKRYATVSRTMGFASEKDSDEAAADALAEGLESLNVRLNVSLLRDCPGVEQARFEQVLEQMAQDALASGSPQNNPVSRPPNRSSICTGRPGETLRPFV